jgi:flagellar hook-length control protein FliK
VPAGAKIAASQSAKAASVVKSAAGDSPAHGTAHSPSRAARAAAKPTANAIQAETADREANVERILRTISSRIGKQRSIATLLLDPPELGNVRLHMDLRKDALTLRMDTQTHVAHRLLTQELDSLRHGLESAGIHLERVEVRPPSPPPEGVGGEAEQQADGGEHWQDESAEPGAEHPDGQGTEAHGRQGTEAEWGSITSAGHGATGGQEGPAAESLVNVLA